jgi:hypothetical protein
MKKYLGFMVVLAIAGSAFAATLLTSCNKQNIDLSKHLFENTNSNNNTGGNNNNTGGGATGQPVTAIGITVHQYSISGQPAFNAIVKLAKSEDDYYTETWARDEGITNDIDGSYTYTLLENGQKYWVDAEYQLGPGTKLTNAKSFDPDKTPNAQGRLDTITAFTRKTPKTILCVVQ